MEELITMLELIELLAKVPVRCDGSKVYFNFGCIIVLYVNFLLNINFQ
jgi:hypothetical protein